ncbi:hypothetical protein, partial [Duganella sp. Dugasp56]|uniref:hypothetical protein n=1 Tax=Duganella sp. Dugasp56 TaxID=3243046 RepID=UPI0039AFB319
MGGGRGGGRPPPPPPPPPLRRGGPEMSITHTQNISPRLDHKKCTAWWPWRSSSVAGVPRWK